MYIHLVSHVGHQTLQTRSKMRRRQPRAPDSRLLPPLKHRRPTLSRCSTPFQERWMGAFVRTKATRESDCATGRWRFRVSCGGHIFLQYNRKCTWSTENEFASLHQVYCTV